MPFTTRNCDTKHPRKQTVISQLLSSLLLYSLPTDFEDEHCDEYLEYEYEFECGDGDKDEEVR